MIMMTMTQEQLYTPARRTRLLQRPARQGQTQLRADRESAVQPAPQSNRPQQSAPSAASNLPLSARDGRHTVRPRPLDSPRLQGQTPRRRRRQRASGAGLEGWRTWRAAVSVAGQMCPSMWICCHSNNPICTAGTTYFGNRRVVHRSLSGSHYEGQHFISRQMMKLMAKLPILPCAEKLERPEGQNFFSRQMMKLMMKLPILPCAEKL